MLLLAFVLQPLAAAAQDCEPVVGQLASVDGRVEVQRHGSPDWSAGELRGALCQGDSIRVGERSRAAIALRNQAVLRLDENTTMRLVNIAAAETREKSFLELLLGALQSFSRKPLALELNTPYLNGSIEGTEFLVRVGAEATELTVLEGLVAASNAQGQLAVAAGNSVVGARGRAPVLRTVVRPRDAVQWALFYPPVLTLQGADESALAQDLPPAVRDALAPARRGEPLAALRALESVPPAQRDGRYHTYRAALALALGRVDEARRDIDAALSGRDAAGTAHALRAIVNLVTNERERALADAERGLQLADTPATRIALSYAEQSRFRIAEARQVIAAGVDRFAGDPLLLARLGELDLMLGDRTSATASAQEAARLAPDLARAQLVLGFAALAQFDAAGALAAFERAVSLESADPLAHLGAGLAHISAGRLAEGRRSLELAVALDSNSALLRAYLGKAYFEERRAPLDAEQYALSTSLDPLDPTAHLYEGIRLQTENRPVEALYAIARSIALNDNRAVYRGRLLLDQDRAARGTSLARAYSDLGFSQLAINAATASLAVDPASTSAHRFLSDSYSTVRRREIARVSELLQAQLLQDVNIAPLQPSASETNLNIVTLGGPASPGFNEFTPLFEQNKWALNVSGFGGTHATRAGEAVASVVHERISLSAGQFAYETGGWRPNNDLTQRVFGAFAQIAATPNVNVQAEFRRRRSEEGDLALNFNPDDLVLDKSVDRAQDSARLGVRVSPRPGSTILASYIHTDRDENLSQNEALDPFTSAMTDVRLNDTGYQLEGQYIHEGAGYSAVVGAGYNTFDRTSDNRLLISNLFLGPLLDVQGRTLTKTRQPHGYAYVNVDGPGASVWTLGASYDRYSEGVLESHSFNPKLGVRWRATDTFELRAAALKVLKPALVNNRTIEPTQVAGFNQFYDDINGTESRLYGLGFEWRLAEGLHLGGEATRRALDEPLFLVGPMGQPSAIFEERDEERYSLYLNWTPLRTLALRGELVFDRYESEQGIATAFANLPEEVRTVSVPVSIGYFHPSGLFATLGATYVRQQVDRSPTATQAQGRSSFVTVDAGLGIRLPERRGTVSLGVRNLFDREFRYQDDSYREFRDEPSTGPYIPERTIMGTVSISF